MPALLLGACLVAAVCAAELPPPAPGDIVALIDAGHFKDADARIDQALKAPTTTPDQRDALLFQRERMRRIRLDFPLTEDEVRAKVK